MNMTKYWTVQEVADMLSYSKLTILRAIRDGRLKALCPGGMGHGKRYRIMDQDLNEFIQAGKVTPAESERGAS